MSDALELERGDVWKLIRFYDPIIPNQEPFILILH